MEPNSEEAAVLNIKVEVDVVSDISYPKVEYSMNTFNTNGKTEMFADDIQRGPCMNDDFYKMLIKEESEDEESPVECKLDIRYEELQQYAPPLFPQKVTAKYAQSTTSHYMKRKYRQRYLARKREAASEKPKKVPLTGAERSKRYRERKKNAILHKADSIS